jgi:hypothetical protein
VITVEGRPCATIAVAFGVTDNRYTSGVPFMVGGDPTSTTTEDTTESTTEQVRFTAGKVFVLDRHGEPLMPCHPARARQLLDGWNYHHQKEETKTMAHNSNGGAFPPRPEGRGLHAPEER